MKNWKLQCAAILGLLTIYTTSSCYYDVEEVLYPNGCNTTEVAYSGDIAPLLDRSCITCHNDLSQNGGINLEGYENVLRQVESGKLIGAISHDPGFSAMPQGGPKLSACSISKVQAWIDAGAPDN